MENRRSLDRHVIGPGFSRVVHREVIDRHRRLARARQRDGKPQDVRRAHVPFDHVRIGYPNLRRIIVDNRPNRLPPRKRGVDRVHQVHHKGLVRLVQRVPQHRHQDVQVADPRFEVQGAGLPQIIEPAGGRQIVHHIRHIHTHRGHGLQRHMEHRHRHPHVPLHDRRVRNRQRRRQVVVHDDPLKHDHRQRHVHRIRQQQIYRLIALINAIADHGHADGLCRHTGRKHHRAVGRQVIQTRLGGAVKGREIHEHIRVTRAAEPEQKAKVRQAAVPFLHPRIGADQRGRIHIHDLDPIRAMLARAALQVRHSGPDRIGVIHPVLSRAQLKTRRQCARRNHQLTAPRLAGHRHIRRHRHPAIRVANQKHVRRQHGNAEPHRDRDRTRVRQRHLDVGAGAFDDHQVVQRHRRRRVIIDDDPKRARARKRGVIRQRQVDEKHFVGLEQGIAANPHLHGRAQRARGKCHQAIRRQVIAPRQRGPIPGGEKHRDRVRAARTQRQRKGEHREVAVALVQGHVPDRDGRGIVVHDRPHRHTPLERRVLNIPQPHEKRLVRLVEHIPKNPDPNRPGQIRRERQYAAVRRVIDPAQRRDILSGIPQGHLLDGQPG